MLLLSVFVMARSANCGIDFVGIIIGPTDVAVGGGSSGVLTTGGGSGVLGGGTGVDSTTTARVGIIALGVRKSLSQAG